jgi:hypothetical protein
MRCFGRNEPLVDIQWMAEQLHGHMFAESASFSTSHLLARDYASKFIELASKLKPGNFSSQKLADVAQPFASMPRREWGAKKVGRSAGSVESPLNMDFENYTLGRLVPGRSNYNYDDPAYQAIRAKILWRIKNLGWTHQQFASTDQDISSRSHRSYRVNESKVERYGKKYSWIAYYEMAGQLADEEKLELYSERFTADIDPVFPIPMEDKSIDTTDFLGNADIDTKDWITNSAPPDLTGIVTVDMLDGAAGPWVLLNALINEESKRLDRNFYIDVQASFFDEQSAELLKAAYENVGFKKIERPDIGELTRVYAGELYWCNLVGLDTAVKFEITIGTEKEEIENPFLGMLETIDKPKIEYINAYQPVAKYGFGGMTEV